MWASFEGYEFRLAALQAVSPVKKIYPHSSDHYVYGFSIYLDSGPLEIIYCKLTPEEDDKHWRNRVQDKRKEFTDAYCAKMKIEYGESLLPRSMQNDSHKKLRPDHR